MNRNPRSKHLKRINAPRHWLLDKLSGVWAPRPSPGPHKLRECLPIIILLRNRLKYALTGREVKMIVMSRHIRVDGKVRTDTTYPCGFQDVVTINRTGEHFRLIYNTKGRFHLSRIPVEDANWKLCKIVKKAVGARAIPYVVTHDGRTIPYPNPKLKVGDTIKYDFFKGKVMDLFEWRNGVCVMVIGGRNVGRVGILQKTEKHPGSFDIVHVKDSSGHEFATRRENLFVLGKGTKPAVRLPPGKGVKLDVVTDRELRLNRMSKPKPNQNEKKLYVGTKFAKKTILPPKVAELRKSAREKKKLLRLVKEQDRKSSVKKPKVAKKKKAAKKKAPDAQSTEVAKPAED